ncbi:hypothetical protein MTO96_015496 [Rhipicephalus appendiculatus]
MLVQAGSAAREHSPATCSSRFSPTETRAPVAPVPAAEARSRIRTTQDSRRRTVAPSRWRSCQHPVLARAPCPRTILRRSPLRDLPTLTAGISPRRAPHLRDREPRPGGGVPARCVGPQYAEALPIERTAASKNRDDEESSESEAEAIAERYSKWVTFGKPCVLSAALMTASLNSDTRGSKDDHPDRNAAPCFGLADDAFEHAAITSASEGSELHPLNDERSERLLDFSDLIEATTAQLERAGYNESPWTPLHLGKDQLRQVPLEEKMAAWDPCQEDSYALSPPGELELFELDVLRPRRPRPAALMRRSRTCSPARGSSRKSTSISPERFMMPLPQSPPSANPYEDLLWIAETSQKLTGSPGERTAPADRKPSKVQPQPSFSSSTVTSAEWRSNEAFAPIDKTSSSVLLRVTSRNSRPALRSGVGQSTTLHVARKDCLEDAAGVPGLESSSDTPASPLPDGAGTRNRMPAAASPAEVASGPAGSGTQGNETREDVASSSKPAQQESPVQEEKHHRIWRCDKRLRKALLNKLKKKERALSTRLARSEADMLPPGGRRCGMPE